MVKIQFDKTKMRLVAARVKEMILERTLAGIDADGRPFKPYSTDNLPVPAITSKTMLEAMIMGGDIEFPEGGAPYIKGGYAKWKEYYMAATDWDGTVNLSLTGEMLNAFTVIDVGDKGYFKLGFMDNRMAYLAMQIEDQGRVFLGLSDEDKEDPILKKRLLAAVKTVELPK